MADFKYRIEFFDPSLASEGLWDEYFCLLEEIFREIRPSDPLPSRNFGKKIAINPHPFREFSRWVIIPEEGQEKIIGRGIIGHETEKSPSFESNANVVFGQIEISKRFRQMRLGTECMKILALKAKELGKTIFQSNVSLEAGHCFCQKLGGLKAIEAVESRLYLCNVDWNMMEQWRKQGAEFTKGVIVESFSDVPEENFEDYTNFLSEVLNQQPLGEIDTRFKTTPQSQRVNERKWKERGIQFITMITKEKDGTISGMTDRYFNPEEPHKIHVGATGVKQGYRGRGLGKWLKAEMLYYIKNKYPSVLYELTGNATTNAPMLSINNRMGYKPHSIHTTYKFNLSDLSKKLALKYDNLSQ